MAVEFGGSIRAAPKSDDRRVSNLRVPVSSSLDSHIAGNRRYVWEGQQPMN